MSEASLGRLRRLGVTAFAWLLLFAGTSSYAQPGLNKEPWSGQKYDKAAMAVIMRQIDTGSTASSSSLTAGTSLVCGGGGGTSSATANSSCIIVNNGSAQILLPATGNVVVTWSDSWGSVTTPDGTGSSSGTFPRITDASKPTLSLLVTVRFGDLVVTP